MTLSEGYAETLRAQAERLAMPPTTLAARLLERTLDDRKDLNGEARATPPPDPRKEAELLAAVAGIQQELQALRRAQQSRDLKSESRGAPPPDPRRDAEQLAALADIQHELQALRRAQQNIAVKLLHSTAGLSAAQINEWVGRFLND